MGILAEPLQYIRDLNLTPGFDVCELGDQYITHGERRLAKDYFLQDMGAAKYVSIDGNARGTYTHDLNYPLPKGFGQFDLVTDFGTGEHVFNQAQVWKTLHYLTRAGGYIVFDRPTQGYPVHCFYNTNMCLFEDLAAVNEYQIIRLEHAVASRGELIRGVFRRVTKDKFRIPYQGRYRKLLRPITTPS